MSEEAVKAMETGAEGDTADMEEGELSDDGMTDEALGVNSGRTPIKMDLPDLLKELSGAEDFNKVDKETMSRMAARAQRFQTGGPGDSISFEDISKLYRSMQVNMCSNQCLYANYLFVIKHLKIYF